MDKVAIIELGTNQIKLSVVRIEAGKYFEIEKEYAEYVGIDQHLEDTGMIKTVKIKECIEILKMYKELAEAEHVNKFHCVASSNLTKAKNYVSFIEEASAELDLDFKLLDEEEEINTLYTAVVNTIDLPKGLIVSISTASTRLIYYCRRVVLHSVTLPIGVTNFTSREDFMKRLATTGEALKQIDNEVPVIGSSETFTSFARLARKKNKYPFPMNHNYNSTRDGFQDVLTFLQGLDVEKSAKLRGISATGLGALMNGMEIALAVMDYTGLSNLVINRSGRNMGIAHKLMQAGQEERPVTDVCLNSVETVLWANNLDLETAKYRYALASSLYAQLKVLHKLPRSYIRVLKVATWLYDLGSNVNCHSYERLNYYAILNANLKGLTHREIALAAFISSSRNWDDFMLAEWVKYKDLLTEEDLVAVRKLALLAHMADIMNLRRQKVVKDISCDVLGDSVIIKLVTETDLKKNKVNVDAAKTEIFCLQKVSKEFTRIFKKNVEIL